MRLQVRYINMSIARCKKCGDEILGDEDSLCGGCSGEEKLVDTPYGDYKLEDLQKKGGEKIL